MIYGRDSLSRGRQPSLPDMPAQLWQGVDVVSRSTWPTNNARPLGDVWRADS